MKSDPVATYRLQLSSAFDFADAAAMTGYLTKLGVSHLYLSPILQAAEGSQSGYDVVDPSRISRALGGEAGFAALADAARQAGLHLMVDIVPNHLSISDQSNPWWWDVLENGIASRYARYFDVDWDTGAGRAPDQVLLPVLGDHFGRTLDAGELAARFRENAFELVYAERSFPVDPRSYAELLAPAARRCGSDRLAFVASSYARLPRPEESIGAIAWARDRDKRALSGLLEDLCQEQPEVKEAIQAEVDTLNRNREALAAFIERQNYRLAYWRIADADLGYRRFFNINDLIGLRVESEEVFRETHRLPEKWAQEGRVAAFRVDHPDGLRDPLGYFENLRRLCPGAWVVVEKILEADEALPEDWPVDGTTGYDFLNDINGIFVDPAAEAELTAFYRSFSEEEQQAWEKVAAESKREALKKLLGSDLNRLAALLQEICYQRRRHRDHTLKALREALVAVAAAFPVYRTYARADGDQKAIGPVDQGYVREAIEKARATSPEVDSELLDLLQEMLLLESLGDREREFVMRFQQLTGPAMAKGLEDTAFYRYYRFLSLNEVGGDPGRFGRSRTDFHERCRVAAKRWPRSLLASSTHDTKRSEDVRARLNVISEAPEAWRQACLRWRELSREGSAATPLDGNTEYLIYQSLVGAWPIDQERALEFARKAIREAKRRTTWTEQNRAYEESVEAFIAALYSNPAAMDSIQVFVSTIQRSGWLNGLSQTMLKLAAPGVPDIYQGCELWDYSLVDPDNRRPVDFRLRRELLDELGTMDAVAAMKQLETGGAKLWLIQRMLQLRKELSGAFGEGAAYEPVAVRGERERHALSFQRGEAFVAVVGRWFQRLDGHWGDTRLELPQGRWRDALNEGKTYQEEARLDELLATLPVAALRKE